MKLERSEKSGNSEKKCSYDIDLYNTKQYFYIDIYVLINTNKQFK